MARTLPAVALLVVLALLGGCLTGPAAPTDSPSPTVSTESPSPTGSTDSSTSTSSTDCPYVLTVERASDQQVDRVNETTAYANLSDERRQEFDEARRDGELELGDSLPSQWGAPRIVEYEGEQYYAVAYVC